MAESPRKLQKAASLWLLMLLAAGCSRTLARQDQDQPPQPAVAELPPLTIEAVTVEEGDVATFRITAAGAVAQDVMGSWRTVDGTAISTGAHPDFAAVHADFVIWAGAREAVVRVGTTDDLRHELTQIFNVEVGDAGLNMIAAVATATVVDDDPPPTLHLSAPAVQEGEDALVTVRVGHLSELPVFFDWVAVPNSATMAADLSPASGRQEIGSDIAQTTIVIPTLEDSAPETQESFFVAIHAVEQATFAGAPAIAVEIVDDDAPRVAPCQVSAGGQHSCVLWSDGKIRCWGTSAVGYLGNGGAHVGDEPAEMGAALRSVDLGAQSATAIALGGGYACSILADASLKCWGLNNWNQLGNGGGTSRGDNLGDMGANLPAVDFGSVPTALQVVTGSGPNCALLTDGRVKCWGLNADGALGVGDTVQRRGGISGGLDLTLPFADIADGVPVMELAGGGLFFCARLSTGDVKCWGRNIDGQLGQGDTEPRGDQPGEMGTFLLPVDLGPGRTSVELCAGGRFACARLDDNTVKCWGNGSNGVLGQGTGGNRGDEPGEMGAALPAIDFGSVDTATQLACGGVHACAVLTNGDLKCWGDNGRGQLGLGDTTNRGGTAGPMGDALASVDLGGLPVVAIDAGGDVTCATLQDGASKVLKCWGRGKFGSLGQGHQADIGAAPGDVASLPAIVIPGGDVIDVGLSGTTTCAVMADGAIRCWGKEDGGTLGYPRGNVGDEPGEVPADLVDVDLGPIPAKDLNSGPSSSCATLEDGRLVCWGNSGQGRLGGGTYEHQGDNPGEMGDVLTAVNFGTGRTALQVRSGTMHRCALLDDFSVKCWGRGNYWALGTGTRGDIGNRAAGLGDNLATVDLGTGRYALSIAAGGQYSCAVLDDLTVKCWGTSLHGVLGQLGVSQTRGPEALGDALPAIDLGSDFHPTQVHAGGSYACALRPGVSAKCWGYNDSAQLLTGDRDSRGDDAGELGDDLAPLDLGDGSVPMALSRAAHTDTVCAMLADATLKCWGNHADGQAGIGPVGGRVGNTMATVGNNLPVVELGSAEPVIDVAAGGNHVCALLQDGVVKCWGANAHGQLGLGDTTSRGNAIVDMGAGLPAVPLP